MMKQSSFSDVEFACKKKLTLRDRFIDEIEELPDEEWDSGPALWIRTQ